ncbi:MAG: hypothetical protein H7256_11200 [Bdellovibrio sp.]|nr:hypothetical protein [Bdellovibrio sp.]
MKLRHFILFLIAGFVLILSDLTGGSLLALFAWLQIYNLIAQKEFNRKTQTWAGLLFLVSLPFVFFWGSIHSFLFVYLAEKQFLFSVMALFIDYCLCLIATIYFIFAFEVAATAEFKVIRSLKLGFDAIKTKKATYFKLSSLFLIFSLVPWLHADWKIVFAVMATQLFLHRHQLKQVYGSGL